MKIGIFGGTFNPIHLGHTALASYICNLGLVDEVWLMVSPQNPFKRDHQLLDEAIRLRLATLAVRDFPRLRASDFEFHLPRPSYTYVTLQELSRAYPDDAFSLIIGADNWDAFPKWRNANDILAHYPIIVYPREKVRGEGLEVRGEGLEVRGERLESAANNPNPSPLTPNPKTPPTNCQLPIANCQFLNSAPLYPISSTAIRTAIAAGDDVSPWLDPAVLDEIRRLRLYAQ
ncbi:MAG: nicotinate (nicotinamide) nucleotide adenylyltransferase [Bacteroidaceae bacterium]|nr:nicotinate (nicotinamide) nucleotide adenylyltransferase [Bacteroidaceae bacterium]